MDCVTESMTGQYSASQTYPTKDYMWQFSLTVVSGMHVIGATKNQEQTGDSGERKFQATWNDEESSLKNLA